jgi:hypothetical protein
MWSLNLKEEPNRVKIMRKLFEPKKGEEFRIFHSEELNDLYTSHSTVRIVNCRG